MYKLLIQFLEYHEVEYELLFRNFQNDPKGTNQY